MGGKKVVEIKGEKKWKKRNQESQKGEKGQEGRIYNMNKHTKAG